MLRREMARMRPDFVAVLLIACGLLVFVPNLTGYFLADDFVLLSWTRVSSLNDVVGFFDPNVEWFYRPIVKVIYWAGQSVFGLRAAPFHLVSLLLHGLNAYLIYRLVVGSGACSRAWVVGLAAGLLFLLNSHHAETVSWVAAIGDLGGLFCILAALLLFRRFRSSGRPLLLAGSVGVFALGLLTRETVVVLPLLLAVDALIFGRVLAGKDRGTGIGRLVLAFSAYVVFLFSYFILQLAGRGSVGRGGLQFRVLNFDSILLGIFDYVHGLIPGGRTLATLSLDTLRTVVLVEALAVVALLGLLLWQRQRLALFGLVWMIATPLLFVFFTGPTDRYFYLPSVGYALFAAGLVSWLVGFLSSSREQNGRIARAVGALVLAAMLLTQARDLVVKESAWHAAGKVSGGVYNDVKRLVPNAGERDIFYFLKLPPFMDGVPVFQNALPQAVQLIYDNPTLFTVTPSECGELQGAPNTVQKYFFTFKGDGVRKFAGEIDCP
ncbi:MAG: hypothetical protein ABIO92_08990 [Chloroflexia bacterium]